MENKILVKHSETLNIQSLMQRSGEFCDVRLHLDDGGTFDIHRVIMCASCSFLRALFVFDSGTNVHIKSIRSEIMQCVIDFAYNSTCKITELNVIELMATAEYLGFPRLVDECAKFILSIINETNCISLWTNCRNYVYSHKVQDQLRNYISYNFNRITEINKEIFDLPCDDLYDVITDDTLNVQTEESVWEFCLRWIEHDETNRIQFTSKLLQGIRFGLMDLYTLHFVCLHLKMCFVDIHPSIHTTITRYVDGIAFSNYFWGQVRDHLYMRLCPSAKSIIGKTMRFLFNLEDKMWQESDYIPPSLAIPRLPCEVVFAIGGWLNSTPTSIVETYDNRAKRWISACAYSDYGKPRVHHGATEINRRIFCIGSYDPGEPHNSCRVFDTETKSWSERAPMHHRRGYAAVCTLNGKIYVMGGNNGSSRLYSCEVYNPETNQWTLIANMNRQRSDGDACVLNGRIYITGGFDGHNCTNSCEVYDVEKNEWSMIGDMWQRRSGHKCVAFKDCIYVMGGFDGRMRLKLCEKYNPNTNSWSLFREMSTERANFGAAVIDGTIFVAGGYSHFYITNTSEYYIDNENKWYAAPAMNYPRSGFTMNTLRGLTNVADFVSGNFNQID